MLNAQYKKAVRSALSDSSLLFFSVQASSEMSNIGMAAVRFVLESGKMVEAPVMNDKGYWEVEFHGSSQERAIAVVTVMEEGSKIIVRRIYTLDWS